MAQPVWFSWYIFQGHKIFLFCFHNFVWTHPIFQQEHDKKCLTKNSAKSGQPFQRKQLFILILRQEFWLEGIEQCTLYTRTSFSPIIYGSGASWTGLNVLEHFDLWNMDGKNEMLKPCSLQMRWRTSEPSTETFTSLQCRRRPKTSWGKTLPGKLSFLSSASSGCTGSTWPSTSHEQLTWLSVFCLELVGHIGDEKRIIANVSSLAKYIDTIFMF